MISPTLPISLQDSAIQIEYDALNGLSRSYSDFGQIDKAVDFAQQALKYAQTIHKPNLEVEALLRLSFLYTNSFQALTRSDKSYRFISNTGD